MLWPTVRLVLCLPLAAGVFAQTPSFGTPLSLPAQKGSLAIAAADFNGDGLQDLAVANTSVGTISIFLNSAGGVFSSDAPVNLPPGCNAAYLTAGNFTGAASPDLLTVCAQGGIVVLPNAGHGTFGAPVSTPLPVPSWVGNLMLGDIHPAIADFNGDGHLDIVVPTFDLNSLAGGWYLLLGKGNGSFQTPSPLVFSGEVPLSLAAADFNGDGKPDLVTAVADANGNPSLEFAAGNGDGTFAAVTTLVSLPTTIGSLILPADINGDGNLDVVFAGSSLVTALNSLTNSQSTGASAVTVFLGDGKGGFGATPSFNITESTYMSGAALANVFGTGKLDLIQTVIQGNLLTGAAPTGAIEIRPGNGDGTFANPIALPFPSTTVPTDLAVADFNGDGRPDIAIASLPSMSIGNIGSFTLSLDLNALLSQVLARLPSGDANVLLNTTPAAPLTFSDANGASFATGPVASGSIVSAFGTGLAASTALASSLLLPTMLNGVTIAVKDSAGTSRNAPLFYVSLRQINYAIPDGTASGQAAITIQSGASSFVATQQIVSVAPGLFSANGYAAGSSVSTTNGVQQTAPLIQNGTPVPVDVAGGQTFLVLYGTGIRNHSTPVMATVGDAQITPAYAGAQGVYVGEDQINIQLPASLQGAGTVAVSLLVDGQASNSVQVVIQ